MLADARPGACAEAAVNELWESLWGEGQGGVGAWGLPSLGKEFLGVWEVFWVVVVSEDHYCYGCAFFYWEAVQVVIAFCPSHEQMGSRPITPRGLFLHHLNILKILQILIPPIFLTLSPAHKHLDLVPNLPLNFPIPRNLVDHHLCEICRGVRSGYEECCEFFEDLLFGED